MSEIDLPFGRVAGDEAIAAAVKAGRETVRYVEIKRDRAHARAPVAALGVLAQLRFCEGVGEMGCGRIRGIAGPGPIVPFQKVDIEWRHAAHGGEFKRLRALDGNAY